MTILMTGPDGKQKDIQPITMADGKQYYIFPIQCPDIVLEALDAQINADGTVSAKQHKTPRKK